MNINRFLPSQHFILTRDLECLTIDIPRLTQHSPTNPSIVNAQEENKLVVTVRGVRNQYFKNKYIGVNNENYILVITENLSIENYDFIEDRHIQYDKRAENGIEDLRIFWWKQNYWVLGTTYCGDFSHNCRNLKNTMILAKLIHNTICEPFFISSPKNAHREKNWVPVPKGEKLYYIYRCSPFTLYEQKEFDLIDISCNFNFNMKSLRTWSGSSVAIPFRDGYLAIFHNRVEGYFKKYYEHRVIQFDDKLNVKKIGHPFCFEHMGIEFCAGLAFKNDCAFFSYGVGDTRAVVMKIHLRDFITLL